MNTKELYLNPGNTLLDIKNISVDYYAANGTVHALTDGSISLERGQILGLAGESGSGKSTLAYAVTRLLHPPAVITGGEVLYYPRAKDQGGTSPGYITEPGDIPPFMTAHFRTFRWRHM